MRSRKFQPAGEALVEQRVDVRALLGGDLSGEHVPAELLEHDAVLQQSCLTLFAFACGRSILLMAIDQRNARVLRVRDGFDRLRHHVESSAATTSTTMSVTCAPRWRMAVKAS